MRYVDILTWHDGSRGAAGVPDQVVEHDGKRVLGAGETRMTVEEYQKRTSDEWAAKIEEWREKHPPPRVVLAPPFVTNFQLRAALMRRGLFDAVDAAVRSAGGEAWQAWEYANVVNRHSPLVKQIADGLAASESEMDALFAEAEQIEA